MGMCRSIGMRCYFSVGAEWVGGGGGLYKESDLHIWGESLEYQ